MACVYILYQYIDVFCANKSDEIFGALKI